ncbi:MAG: hypothetical protein OQK73_12535 [Gammaproteobacteria bacterium]|nr:hypothetical protein [Gammaproteobacteria bacterium]
MAKETNRASVNVRFIVSVFIISLMTLNIAWATDECAIINPVKSNVLLFEVDNQDSVDLLYGNNCDDWCQGWMNILALQYSCDTAGYTLDNTNSSFIVFSYYSLPIPPPFHPPII